MTRRTSLALAAAALLAVSGCVEDSTGPQGPDLSGTWAGTTAVAGTPLRFQLVLQDEGDRLSGTGEVQAPDDTLDVTVAGTNDHPDVSLRLSAEAYADAVFEGALAGDSIPGRMTGSGFGSQSMVLKRVLTP